MQRLLLLCFVAISACTLESGPSVPDTGAPPARQPAEAESAPAQASTPEEAEEAEPPGDLSALSIPHDMPPLDASCDTRRNFATSHVTEAVTAAAAGCSADADCVRVARGTGCRGGCPTAILARYEDAYETLRSSIDARVCATYRDDACPYATPRCASGEARCVEGTCQLVR